jgi:hypothetical protein
MTVVVTCQKGLPMTQYYGANPNGPSPGRSSASVKVIVGVGAVIVAAIIAATMVIVLTRPDVPDNVVVASTTSATALAPEATSSGGAIDRTTSATAPGLGSLVGTWSGTMNAPNGMFRQWPLRFTLSEVPSVGSVFPLAPHPTLGCSGTASIKEVTGTTFVVRINMREDPLGRCTTRSVATFALRSDGQMDAAWQDLTEPSNTATGILAREP